MFPACEGPEGPQGPPGFDGQDGRDGEDGEDGISFVDLVIEVEWTFSEENDYSFVVPLTDAGIFDDDNFLVYLAWGSVNDLPVWRLLPQTTFFENGFLTYNFQYTSEFLGVFMEGNVDPASLPEEWTHNQLIRILYMPGFFAGAGERLDLSDYDAVMRFLGKSESDVVRVSLK